MWKDIQDMLHGKSKIESNTIFCRNKRQKEQNTTKTQETKKAVTYGG